MRAHSHVRPGARRSVHGPRGPGARRDVPSIAVSKFALQLAYGRSCYETARFCGAIFHKGGRFSEIRDTGGFAGVTTHMSTAGRSTKRLQRRQRSRTHEGTMKVAVYSFEKYDDKHLVPALKAHLGDENVKCLSCRLLAETSDLAGG